MDKVSHIVKQMILNYPTCYKTRLDVLEYVFTTLGNSDVIYSANDLEEREVCDRPEPYGDSVGLSDKYRANAFDFIDTHIDEIAQNIEFFFPDYQSRWFRSHYINRPSSHQTFFTFDPETAGMEWRKVAIEFGEVWSHYFFVKNRMHCIDQVKFNRGDDLQEVGMYLEEGYTFPDHLSDMKKDFENYNIIHKRIFDLHTPEMLEEVRKKNAWAREIIKNTK